MSSLLSNALDKCGVAPSDENLNDIGNAERFNWAVGDDVAYIPERHAWVYWNVNKLCWLESNNEISLRAEMVARTFFQQIAQESDARRQRVILAHAQRSCNAGGIRAMLELAKVRLSVAQSEWDADPYLIGVQNGLVDLREGKLLDAAGTSARAVQRLKTSRVSKFVTADYKPDAECPSWLDFLDQIFERDEETIAFVQRAIGYCLTGATSEQCFFICHGFGANGKSVFLRVIDALMGDYARTCSAETLLARRDGAISNDVARLAGARVVTALETEDGKRLSEAMVKALTGGDKIVARFLHCEFFEFVPAFKVWLATNHKPTIRGGDHGIWRRIRLIPFNVTIPPEKQDRDLLSKLEAERDGILSWAVEGCLAWQSEGLRPSAIVAAATMDYKEDMDRIQQWIEQRCVQQKDVDQVVQVQASAAYADYRLWSEARGEQPLSLTAFGNRLNERGILKDKGRTVTYKGIGLCDTRATLAPLSRIDSPNDRSRMKNKENDSQVSLSLPSVAGA